MPTQKDQIPIRIISDAAGQAGSAESKPAYGKRIRVGLFQVVLVFIAGAFAGLTFLVKTNPLLAIDLQITNTVQLLHFPPVSWLMVLVSWPGFSPQALIIAGFLIFVAYSLGRHWEAVVMFIAAFSSSAINILVKDLVQRPRPLPELVNVYASLSSYSFPSGHVMFYIGFFGFIGFLACSILKPSLKRTLLLVLTGGLIVLIGVSRIYLGEHWASDVLGSYLLGSLVLVASITIYLWGRNRFFIDQPAQETSLSQSSRG